MENFHVTRTDDPLVGVPELTEIRRSPVITMRDPQQGDEPRAFELNELFQHGAERAWADARSYADYLVEQANATAKDMVDQARMLRDAELDAARQQGYREGYESGYSEGMSAADRESAGLIHTAEQIALQAVTERSRAVQGAELAVVELAIDIAHKIVNMQVAIDPQIVLEVCRGAIRKAFNREQLMVLAHPDDLATLRAHGPEMVREMGGVKHLEFVEERRMERGSVVVRTPAGEIDATFDGKADKLLESFREVAEQRRAVHEDATDS